MRGRAGFLLVEALAALALGALILVALLSLTGLLRRSADRAAYGVETMETSQRTVEAVARELRRATRQRWAAPPPSAAASKRVGARSAGANAQTPPPPVAETEQGDAAAPDGAEAGNTPKAPPRPFVFSGSPDRVTFVLAPRQPSGLRAPVFVAWQFEESGATLRAEAPLPPDALGPDSIQLGAVERVDPGPERLRFAYFERGPSGAETILDTWVEPLKMPAAIRIDRLEPGTGRTIGSLRVPLLIDAEPACAGRNGVCSRYDAGSSGGARSRDGAALPDQGEPQ
ncbi:hypothetical protein [Methylopila sp. M107]|uniref:hypothetical protein n=1 Tax=Methylopila sp. M107 TaxID=1101190 RepID=UPI00036695CC|nr:hypothetical protein [Methylopila sp. M107]